MRDISLSATDAAALQAIASTYVRETIQQAHHYRPMGGMAPYHSSAVDPAHWKRSAHYRNLTLYREKLPTLGRQRNQAATGHAGVIPSYTYPYDERKVSTQLYSDPALFPATLLLGAMRGDLDNVMFGLLTHTREAMALQQSYIGNNGDGSVEERLLATIVHPSFHDPLRSLALHWRGTRNRNRARLFRSNLAAADDDSEHDMNDIVEDGTVFVRSTGIAHLPDGERVGYELVHSVALAFAVQDTPKNGYERNRHHNRNLNFNLPKLSYCSIYRQRDQDTVEVFSIGAATPRYGEKLAAFGADSGAKKMRTLHRTEAYGRIKKLAWLLAATGEPATLTTSTRARARQSRSCCASCFKSFSAATGIGRRIGRLARLARLRGGIGYGTECSVCSDTVCSRCLISRRLRFVHWSSEGSGFGRGRGDTVITTRSVPFCMKCLQRSEEMSAATVAAHATLDEADDNMRDLRSDNDMGYYGWRYENTTPTCSSHKSASPPNNQTFFCIDDDDQIQEILACDPQDGKEEECDTIGEGVSLRTWQQRWQRIIVDDETPVVVSDVDDSDLWTLESLDVAILGDDAFQI